MFSQLLFKAVFATLHDDNLYHSLHIRADYSDPVTLQESLKMIFVHFECDLTERLLFLFP